MGLAFHGCNAQNAGENYSYHQGAIVRGDTTASNLSLVFTGHEFGEGGSHILETLEAQKVHASFFFTGDFYDNPEFDDLIQRLKRQGHYVGAHSDKHLLYCDWRKRDSLLVTKSEFLMDLRDNYAKMEAFGIQKSEAPYFLPPYEWYNDSISQWTLEEGLQLINITYGTRSHADYTLPTDDNYISSRDIYNSIWKYEQNSSQGLNGFILLMHIGVGPNRQNKFYLFLDDLISTLKSKEYQIVRIDELLK